MMKKWKYICILFMFYACSPESIFDCFTRSGTTETRAFEVDAFDEIIIYRNIALHLTYAENISLQIEAGDNLIDGIELDVNNGVLEIKAQDLCASGTKNPPYIVHLSTPNLGRIRNASQFKVKSTNTLKFDELTLVSENYNFSDALSVGDFELELELNKLNISHAGISDFYLSGKANHLELGIFAGTGRIFSENLHAKTCHIYHRGYGDVHLFAEEKITGELRSTGNLILYRIPETIEIKTFFTGELIFKTE